MAPLKRQRTVADDGDNEIIDVESAQSDLQQTSRKKPRVSYHESEEASSESDEEAFLERATQFATQQKLKSQANNIVADNGIIELVTCVNFMCHEHLEISLGPLINFIIGQNGSGKSAVLTAITLCLGGKASATNRGQSLKSFIKEGQESAVLSVKIKNSGESAYQHDVYGESIIVERHFSRSGSSAFKIKSASGRQISTKKGDLDEICDYFALQIDNPMNVLTQDMARQFLNSSSPQEKYKYFMKGTQLEHLDHDYVIVQQNLDIFQSELWKKEQDLTIFKDRAHKAQELNALSEQQDALRERLDNLTNQMAWVQVETEEKKFAAFEKRLQRVDRTIEGLEMKVSGTSEAFSQTEQADQNAKRGVEEARTALIPLEEDKARVKIEHEGYKAEMLSLQAQQRAIADELKSAERSIEQTKKDIEEEYRRLSHVDGGGHARRRIEIEEKKTELQNSKASLRDYENELPALNDNKDRAEQEHRCSHESVRSKREEVQRAEDRLSTMVRDRGKQQSAYHANMQRLLNAIQQEGGFRQRPVGPIGNHVRLLKPAWSSILEKSFGGALTSFIVTSYEDQRKLSALMNLVTCQCAIMIGKNGPIDTRGHEPDETFDTTLRVVEIDNDLVRRELIIHYAIDQTILIPDRKEAIDLMNNARLANVKQCFAHNIKPGTGIRLAYGYSGGLSESYQAAFLGNPRMKTDIEYQIRSQQETVQTLKSELHNLEQCQRDKRSLLVQREQAIGQHQQALKRKEVEWRQAEAVVEELQDSLDKDAVEEGRVDGLKEQLAEAQEEKTMHESSYEDAVIAKDKLYASVKTTRDHMAQIDKAIREAEVKVHKAESKALQRANERMAALRDKNAAIEAAEKAEMEKVTLQKERDEQGALVEDFINQAQEVSARVPVDEGQTGDSLFNLQAKIDKDLKNMERRVGGSRAQIATKAAKAVEARDRAQAEYDNSEELIQLLKKTLDHRRERWLRFTQYITARAKTQFFYLLSERGFRGKLLANHKQKMLDLRVEPDETQKRAKGRATHGLSGGEKSFSTICLLLAIWEAMGAPIRCLDEFDVFMDSVNREISMEMMITFARNSPSKQFILITPLGVNKKSLDDKDVKTITMANPGRGQRTLNFTRVS